MKVNLVVTFYLFSEAIGIKPNPVFVTGPRAQMKQLLEMSV